VSKLQYREVNSSDIPALAKIRAAEWESEEYWLWRISGYLKCELHPQQALLPRIIYVAVENSTVVGFIAGHLTKRFQCDGELQWINVSPEYRRKGIARGLLTQLAHWFMENRAYKICVDGSGEFYEKLGARQLNKHWMIWDDIRHLLVISERK